MMIRSTTRVILAATVLVAAFALCTSCFSLAPAPIGAENGSAAASLGEIQVSSPALGAITVLPTDCVSGARQYFLGGDFVDAKSGVTVRLAIDPVASPAVRVFSSSAPFDKSVAFRRDECSVFHFSLDSTGWRVNHVDDYRITLKIDCAHGADSVRGTASATHCH